MTGIVILVALFAALLAGIDIAFAMAGLGIIMLLLGGFSPLMIPQAMLSSVDNFILLAVPLFILMANVMLKGGGGERLFSAVQAWIGHWPGGLAVATVASCAIFGASSGSSVATSATIGTVAIPEMIQRGYERRFVYGLLAAGGTLGILIPPSIPMIVFGYVLSVSIVDLFLAGIGPGLLLALVFIVYVVIKARYGSGHDRIPRASWATRRKATLQALPVLVLAFVVVSGIYLGIFTPTEAGGVGFVAALFITLGVYRSLRLRDLPDIARSSMKTTVMILFIIVGAKVFGQAITLYQVPQDVTALVTGSTAGPTSFIVAICALLLALGCVLETLSMMLLMLPIIQPSLGELGIDPVWFGVIFTMMIECALITPPVGLNLFVIQAVVRQDRDSTVATLADIVRGVIPFVFLIIATVTVIVAVPEIALFIPYQL